tara:strand:+ start:8877 stop:9425 length:549 start_codon:yes stop_codon:yes gene_type:complete
MDALKNILERVSARELAAPHPSSDEMKKVFKAALRAPDHAWLRPSKFIEVKLDGLNRLSKVFEDYAKKENFDEKIVEKYKKAPFRAPMIVILITSFKDHPKVPKIEQNLSTATAGQNIMLALNAMNYGSIWRTGKLAFNKYVEERLGLEKNQQIIGYLYIGTEVGKKKEIPNLEIDDFVSYL